MIGRPTSIAATIAILTVVGATPALAHSQTVAPPGQEEPVREGAGVSRLWAQAHCNAASPEVLADRSGVAAFAPAGALPCLDSYENPGGRSHPHADPAGD